MIVLPVVVLGASVPISFAGWGVREGAMVLMLGKMGISSADALALSIVLGLVLMSVSILGGFVWLSVRKEMPGAITSAQ